MMACQNRIGERAREKYPWGATGRRRAVRGFLFMTLLVAAWMDTSSATLAEEAQPISAEAQSELDRVKKMQPADQQAWLRRLEQRALRAVRLSMKPDEAAAQEGRVHAMLYQKTVGWSVLGDLIDETNAREQKAIDQLVRKYRGQIFDAYHKKNYDIYEKWRMAWADVYGEWKNAGSGFRDQDLLIDWLETAMQRVAAGNAEAMPDKPRFTLQSPHSKGVKQPLGRVLPLPAVRSPARRVKSTIQLLPGELPDVPPAQPEPVEKPVEPVSPSEVPAAPTKPVESERHDESPDTPEKDAKKSAEEGGRGAKSAASARTSATAGSEPAGSSPASAPAPNPQAAPRESSPEKSAKESAAESQPAVVPATKEQAPSTGEGKQKSAAPKRKMAESLTATPPVAQSEEALADHREPVPNPVQIDVDELSARIAGCNLELRALETSLDEKGHWDAARLEPLVDRLKILLIRRNDLRLFRESLPEQSRASVASLEAPKMAIAQFGAKIFEIRKRLGESSPAGNDAERRTELSRLDVLSRQLAEMAVLGQ